MLVLLSWLLMIDVFCYFFVYGEQSFVSLKSYIQNQLRYTKLTMLELLSEF